MTTEIDSHQVRFSTQDEIEQLWHDLSDNPQRQALETARLVIDQAPHLVEWLKRKIYKTLSDSELKRLAFQPPPLDGRMQAINELADYLAPTLRAAYQPQEKAITLKEIAAQKRQRRPNQKGQGERIYEAIFGVKPQIVPTRETEPIRVDWELGRICIAINEAAGFRFWIIGRNITRSTNGSGVISIKALKAKIRAYGIDYTKRHFNRLLKDGEGLFWRRSGDYLYLSGSQAVAWSMTAIARNQGILVDRNLPGVRDVYLDPSGPLEQWEAMLYAGWFAGRSAIGHNDVTISRAALSELFGRHETTLRRWEKKRLKQILTVQHNIAQFVDDEATEMIEFPDHAQPYVARITTPAGITQEIRIYWQIPNTYHADIKRHLHNGQAKKVRKAAHSTFDPADTQSGGQIRLYYHSPKKLKAHTRSQKFRMGLCGNVNRRIYVYLGTHRRSQCGVFEYTNKGSPITQPNEREQPEAEAVYFATYAQKTIGFWKQRRSYFMA